MPNWKKVITSGSAAVLSDLTLSGVTQPEIKFNGSSDAGVDFAIRATPEGLDFYEPEDSNKIHMQIIDDGGVDAKFGLKIGGTSVLSSARVLQNVSGNISQFTNNSGYKTTFRTVTAGGNTLGANETLAFSAGSNVSISESGGTVTISSTDTNTNTTYSAGNGIGLSGTTFSVSAGTGLSQTSSGLALATAGAGAATYGSTSDGTKIDTITLDAYGRVTAVATGATGDIHGVTAGTGLSGGSTSGTATLNLSHLGLESLTDPNDDRIAFWDDSEGAFGWLDAGSNITISGTTISSTDTNTQLSTSEVRAKFSAGENITISNGEISATDTNTNTVTSIRRDNTGTYRTGNINLVGGTNVTISETSTGVFNISSTDTNTDTNTTYSPGALLDLSGTTFNVDLSELPDMTETFVKSTDEFVVLDSGVQKRKLASEIFGNNAFNSTAFATGDNFDSDGTFASLRAQGTTAGDVGLGNVTNESKATMFSSAALTGNPTAPTQTAGNDSTRIATTAFVGTAIDNLIGGAPGTLDTLDEIAAALNDDNDLHGTLTTSIAGKLPKSGGTMTGAIAMGNNNITGVNNITFADPGPNEGLSWSGGNMKLYESPNDLTTNTAGNLQIVYGTTRRLTIDNTGINVNGNATLSGFVLDGNTITGVDDSGEFTNDDAHIMTSAAVEDKILGYGYTTNTGTTTANNSQTFTNKSGNISQWTNDSGYITSFTNTVTSIRRDNTGTYRTGNINLVGGDNVTISEGSAGVFTISSTDTNTVYSHPTHPGDDINIDTGVLSGATVIKKIDFNVTTDTLGHVTDANGTVTTRTLTLADLGYTGASNANYITNNNQLTNGASYLTTSGKAADSTLLDGIGLGAAARHNVANKVVRTDSNGYANFGWINTTSGNTTGTITDIYVNTNDGFIRKATKAEFQSQMGIQNVVSNTDVDTGTETVADAPLSSYSGYFFDYVVSNGGNFRAGTVTAVEYNGNVEFTETSTNDIGDTSDLVLSCDASNGSDMKLRATAASDNWSVKVKMRLI